MTKKRPRRTSARGKPYTYRRVAPSNNDATSPKPEYGTQLAAVVVGGLAVLGWADVLIWVIGTFPLAALALFILPLVSLVGWTIRKGGVQTREKAVYWYLALYCFISLCALPLAILDVEQKGWLLVSPWQIVGAALSGLLLWYCWWVRDLSIESLPTSISKDVGVFFRRRGLFAFMIRFAVLYWLTIAVFGIVYKLGAVADSVAFNIQPLRLTDAVYFSGTTITTLGYGDIFPLSLWAKGVALLEVFIGVALITTYLAAAVAFFQQSEKESRD